MARFTYEIVHEYQPFRLVYHTPVFGYFILSKSAAGIKPQGGAWYAHSLIYFFRFFTLQVPAFFIDIVLSGFVFLVIRAFKKTDKATDYAAKKGIQTGFNVIGKLTIRIVTFIIIPLLIISLYKNFDTWVKLAKQFSVLFSQLSF